MIVLIGLIVSIILGLICYLSTENVYSSIGILLVSFIYFATFATTRLRKKNKTITCFHQCYQFINNFLIALSIKGNLAGALNSASESLCEDAKECLNNLNSNDTLHQLKYLKNYFYFDAYSLFYDIVSLYEEEGGDIIKMSDHLSNKIRENEEYIIEVERMHKDTLIEFIILWIISLIILVTLRYALTDFFAIISKGLIYQIGVVGILLFCVISIHIAICKISSVKIK